MRLYVKFSNKRVLIQCATQGKAYVVVDNKKKV